MISSCYDVEVCSSKLSLSACVVPKVCYLRLLLIQIKLRTYVRVINPTFSFKSRDQRVSVS